MHWFSRHPILTIVVICGISAAAIFPASKVRIETSFESLMVQKDPAKKFYEQTRDLFGSEGIAVIYIQDPNLFSPARLKALQELVYDLETIDGIESSQSLFSATDIETIDGQLDVHPLIGWAPETQRTATHLKERALAHPLARRQLISDSADATAIHLRINIQNGHSAEMITMSSAIEEIISKYSHNFERLEQMGRPYIIERQKAYILHDQRIILPLAIIVLISMLVAILSSFKGAVLPLLTSGISILWTLGFMGLTGIHITILTFMIPSLIIVIGSTEDIHLLAEYRSGRCDGLNRSSAVSRMITRLAIAVLFTAITTVSGFATMISNAIPVLQEFGIVATFGLLINPLVTISLIPAALKLFPERTTPLQTDQNTPIHSGILSFITHTRKYPRVTLVIFCVPCVAFGVYGASHVKADNNMIGYFKPRSPIVQRADRIHEKLSGIETFCIRLDADQLNAFKQPENLAYAIELQQYLKASGWIDRSTSVTDYLTYIHQSISGKSTRLPKTNQSVAEYLLLLHHSEIGPYATPDFRHLNIITRHNIRSSKELIPKINALEKYIKKTCPPHLSVEVTGESLVVNKAVTAIIKGQVRSIFVVALFAAGLLSILFKSFRIGIIGLIPNLLPICVQFGMMALLAIPLNIATSMAAAVSIGLAVDDTIHLLMRFYSHSPNLSREQAVEKSIQHLIKPVIATSCSLTLGFLVMRFSQFKPICDFALLSAITLVTALLADLLVTPTLLSLPIATASKGHDLTRASL